MYDLARLNFLIVEDNYHMRCILLTILRGFGVSQAFEAADAAEAFEILKAHTVDIILTDLSMQPLDGLEFTRLVRTSEDIRNKFVPIILVTAHSERQLVERARDVGITEFCKKPVSARDLLMRIRSVIEQPRPFIKSKQFLGPDRRRRTEAIAKNLERRNSQKPVKT